LNSELISVGFHASQFPDRVRQDLLDSLRRRQINHKFLYDSVAQTQKWLALHQAYSPARTDPECGKTYDRAFAAAAARMDAPRIHLIGLGCGGGQKDSRLLQLLGESKKEAFYTASDVSSAMVLVARQAAAQFIPAAHCSGLVCDLATTIELSGILQDFAVPQAARVITFFGMLPNFEPGLILPRINAILRRGDFLLLSANLAPGSDYAAGVQQILPLYDNALTRDWLFGCLKELGFHHEDGAIQFGIEEDAAGLRRVTAWFRFERARQLEVYGESFQFSVDDRIRLFFSYRHTSSRMKTLLEAHGLEVIAQWITPAEDEGVFLVSLQ
jgi:uncharacterized SAM-dependent methyltransferase